MFFFCLFLCFFLGSSVRVSPRFSGATRCRCGAVGRSSANDTKSTVEERYRHSSLAPRFMKALKGEAEREKRRTNGRSGPCSWRWFLTGGTEVASHLELKGSMFSLGPVEGSPIAFELSCLDSVGFIHPLIFIYLCFPDLLEQIAPVDPLEP